MVSVVKIKKYPITINMRPNRKIRLRLNLSTSNPEGIKAMINTNPPNVVTKPKEALFPPIIFTKTE